MIKNNSKAKSEFEFKLDKFKTKLNDNPDVVVRAVKVGEISVGFVYLKSMTSDELISKSVVEPILQMKDKVSVKNIISSTLQMLVCKKVTGFGNAIQAILEDSIVFFVEGEEDYVSIDVEDFPTRQPVEPPTSPVLRGPREGFTESIKTNIALIRKRLKTDKLVLKNMFVGKYSNTQVTLCYLKGVANRKIIKMIERKIKSVEVDGVVSSYYIECLLEERSYSMFKQVGSTEKPDICCAKILEGRVAIIVDNSPIVLSLPFIYAEDVQSSNDYYGRYCYATYMRLVRIFGLFMAVIVPGAYLAMRIYHYKIIPLKFLITISNSNQGLPFTPFIEILFILALFEILYEVSLRLPRYLGLATSIVGALILGDTGVKAGLISPPGVMIIAMSIISVYTIPDQAMQLSLTRLIFVLLGGMFGFLGMVAGIIYFCNYLNSLNEYSAPYLSPISPHIPNDRKDALFKKPFIDMKTRPKSFENENKVRMRKK